MRICFAGYEHDPREVYQIREVRRFIQALTERFPYWFHFASRDVDETLWVILQCLLPVGPLAIVDGVARYSIETEDWNKVTLGLFGHMNGLYHHHGLTQAENSATTQQVLRYVKGYMR